MLSDVVQERNEIYRTMNLVVERAQVLKQALVRSEVYDPYRFIGIQREEMPINCDQIIHPPANNAHLRIGLSLG
jgi:hypothetical protein